MSDIQNAAIIPLTSKFARAGLEGYGNKGGFMEKYTSPLLVHIVELSEKGKPRLSVVDQARYSIHETRASLPFLALDEKGDMRFIFAVAVGNSNMPGEHLPASADQAVKAAKFLFETLSPETRLAITNGRPRFGREEFQENIERNFHALPNDSPLKLVAGPSIRMAEPELA